MECMKQEPDFNLSYFVTAHALFHIFAQQGFPESRVVHLRAISSLTGYTHNSTYKKAINALEYLGFVEIVEPSIERVKQAKIALHVPDWFDGAYPTVPELPEDLNARLDKQQKPKSAKKEADKPKPAPKKKVEVDPEEEELFNKMWDAWRTNKDGTKMDARGNKSDTFKAYLSLSQPQKELLKHAMRCSIKQNDEAKYRKTLLVFIRKKLYENFKDVKESDLLSTIKQNTKSSDLSDQTKAKLGLL